MPREGTLRMNIAQLGRNVRFRALLVAALVVPIAGFGYGTSAHAGSPLGRPVDGGSPDAVGPTLAAAPLTATNWTPLAGPAFTTLSIQNGSLVPGVPDWQAGPVTSSTYDSIDGLEFVAADQLYSVNPITLEIRQLTHGRILSALAFDPV